MRLCWIQRAGVALAIAAVLVVSGCSPATPARTYVDRWAGDLLKINDPMDALGHPDQYYPDTVFRRDDGTFVRILDSGEWVMARASAFHAEGVEYDATVLVDSGGAAYYFMDYHWCDEGIVGQALGSVDATDLATFYVVIDSEWPPLSRW